MGEQPHYPDLEVERPAAGNDITSLTIVEVLHLYRSQLLAFWIAQLIAQVMECLFHRKNVLGNLYTKLPPISLSVSVPSF